MLGFFSWVKADKRCWVFSSRRVVANTSYHGCDLRFLYTYCFMSDFQYVVGLFTKEIWSTDFTAVDLVKVAKQYYVRPSCKRLFLSFLS